MTSTVVSAVVAVSRSFELALFVKATLIVVIGLVAVWITRRVRASVRHMALAVTFATLTALPLAVVAGPKVAIRLPAGRVASDTAGPAATSSTSMPATSAAAAASDRSRPWTLPVSVPSLLRIVWLAGAGLSLTALAAGLLRLQQLRRQALPLIDLQPLTDALARDAGVNRRIDALEHAQVPAPLTCGLFRPVILLPADVRTWAPEDLRRALVHEIEHVRRADFAVQTAATVVAALYWFHPLVRVASRRLGLEAERACDDAVVRGGDGMEYADQLVVLARRMSELNPVAVVGMAVPSDLSARVTALLDTTQRRGRAGLVAGVSAAFVAAATVIAVAPLHAVAVSPSVFAEADEAQQRTPGRRVRGIDRAIYEASENGDIGEIDELLRAGANVNAAVSGDGSPLIAAARTARLAVVRHLLDRGANPNMGVSGDGSPLIAAAGVGAVDVVALLLDRGAAVDQVVPGDENALIGACREGHLEVVKLLVARGADVHARVWAQQGFDSKQGEWRTPLNMARRGGHTAVVSFLRAAGAVE